MKEESEKPSYDGYLKCTDEYTALQYTDPSAEWYDDPDHHDMFEDDPQSDADYKAELDKFIKAIPSEEQKILSARVLSVSGSLENN